VPERKKKEKEREKEFEWMHNSTVRVGKQECTEKMQKPVKYL
jgi:hypothetical protein